MQTAIVSLVALAAFLIVARRVVRAIWPPKGSAACPSCASGSEACATSSGPTAASATSDVHPLVLVKSKIH